MTVGVDGYLPLGDRARLLARGGMLMWELGARVVVLGVAARDSEEGNDPYLGIGAEFDVLPALSVAASFSRYDLDERSFNLPELSLRYRFGAR